MTWATAWHSLDVALANQLPGGTIWVADGTYTPSNQTTGFYITKPLQLYGGFVGSVGGMGGETSIDQRLPANFANTILDGGTFPNQCLHVITISELETEAVVLDGFKIQDGNCLSTSGNGGGINAYCVNLNLANLTVTDNVALNGGGLYFKGGCPYLIDPEEITGPPRILKIKNSHFINNVADSTGGGIFGELLYGEIVNVDFRHNHCPVEGGGVYLSKMGPTNRIDFIDCVFFGNFVTVDLFAGAGGGLRLSESNPPTNPPDGGNAQLINCSFGKNTCNQGSDGQALGISTNSACSLYNSILWWNYPLATFIAPISGTLTAVTDSDIQGWLGGGIHVIQSDPLWVDVFGGDLRLSTDLSLCVDAADWDKRGHDNLDVDGDHDVTELLPLDVLLQPRTVDRGQGNNHGGHGSRKFLDMGAHERQTP
jgi:hypothetical protein